MTGLLLERLAAAVGVLISLAAAVVGLVAVMLSDAIIVAAVSAAGALLVSLVGLAGTLVTVRLSREAKTLAESTHHHVTVNGHGTAGQLTIPDRLADLADQVTEVREEFSEHVVIGRGQMGDLRHQVTRLARDFERHAKGGPRP